MSEAIGVGSPEHGRHFRGGGWTKGRRREGLQSLLTLRTAGMGAGAGGLAEGMPPWLADRREEIPKFVPDGLWFVHAGGGAGGFSAIISGWIGGRASSEMTTVAIDRKG